MNSKEVLQVVEVVANEKEVPREVIFVALELALAAAARKSYPVDVDLRISIDRKSGQYSTYRRFEVVADDLPANESIPTKQISLSAAQLDDPGIEVGDIQEELEENVDFARIGAQSAKQVIYQKIREAERAIVAEKYEKRLGELIRGVVKRVERGNIFVDLGENVEAIIPREYAIPREIARSGDHIRAILFEIRPENKGPQIILSRIAPELVMALFDIEVPEINQGTIEMIKAARDPGSRAKIAVKSHDQRIDPIGACVGMRGSRVQQITNELCGERVDIVLWDDNPAQFVINAMNPAEVISIVVDEDRHSMDIAVSVDKLAQAIGRGGQNVRLASELTGWVLNVMTDDEATAKSEQEGAKIQRIFMEHLGVDEEVADILVREGFSSLDEVAYVPAAEMLEIEEFDEDIVEALRAAARDALLARAIVRQELGDKAPTAELIALLDDEELAFNLAKKGVSSVDDLAELATDELLEMIEMDETKASALIMAARKTWFKE